MPKTSASEALNEIINTVVNADEFTDALLDDIVRRLHEQAHLGLCNSTVDTGVNRTCGAYRRIDHAFCPACEHTITELYDEIRRAELHRQGLEDWPDHPET